MKRNRLAMILSVFCFSAGMQLPAQPSKTSAPQTLGPEWVSLWNGKDLSGWKQQGKEKWVVEDGAIYGEGVTKEYGYLATEKTYKDFHLSLRFKCEADGNSGVYIHTRFDGDTAKHFGGRQVEIDRRIGRHTAGLYGDGKGWIVWPAPELETVIKPADWNDLLILVEGNRYRTYLNGVQMIDFTYPSPASTDGVIALQLHSGGEGRMRFKDIWIRDLTRPYRHRNSYEQDQAIFFIWNFGCGRLIEACLGRASSRHRDHRGRKSRIVPVENDSREPERQGHGRVRYKAGPAGPSC